MFCNKCGTKNSETAQYCSNDGVPLGKSVLGAQVYRGDSKYCRECSHSNALEAIYCTSCGVSLEKIIDKKDRSFDSVFQKAKGGKVHTDSASQYNRIKDVVNKNNLIEAAKFTGIGFGIIFILSLIISFTINRFLRGMIADELSYGFGSDFGMVGESLLGNIKFISFSDVMMLSHMVGTRYTADMMLFEFFVEISSGLFFFLIIPAIAMLITGYLLNRRYPTRSIIDRIYSALSVSIVYAILIGFIGIFAGVSLSMPSPDGLFGGEITVSANYSFFTALINAFIISMIFTTLGSMIGLSKQPGARLNLNFGTSIYRAILTSIAGILIMFVVSFATISSSEADAELDTLPKTITASQFSGYFWNLAHLGKISFQMSDGYEMMNASYSLFGGADAIVEGQEISPEEQQFFSEFIKDLLGFSVWFALIIAIGLHVWSGIQLGKVSNGILLHELGAYGVAFGIINAAFTSMTNFSIDSTLGDLMNIAFGFSTISIFFFSALIAFAASYVGVMLSNKSPGHHTEEKQAA